MVRIVLLISLFLIGIASGSIEDAHRHFECGQYAEGQSTLFSSLRTEAKTPEEKAEVYSELGRFYDQLVGDPLMARIQWENTLSLELISEHPLRKEATQSIARVDHQQQQFATAYQLLADATKRSDDPATLNEQLQELETLLRQTPDFPATAQTYYWRGHHLAALKKYGRAVRAFDHALTLKPALGLLLPVKSGRALALQEFKHRTIPPVMVLLVALIWLILFRSASTNPLIPLIKKTGLQLFVGWTLFFIAFSALLLALNLDYDDLPYSRPILLKRLWIQPGGIRLLAIFGIGLWIGSAVWLAALASANWKRRAQRIGFMVVIAWGLTALLSIAHYYQFLTHDTAYFAQRPGGIFYTLIRMNEHELPSDRDTIIRMIINASIEEEARLLEYHLPQMDPKEYVDKSPEEIADLLLQQEK